MRKLIATAAAALLCAGCVTVKDPCIVAVKQTTFGIDISADPTTGTPHVRFGLVRLFYQRIPLSTNRLYAPPYQADVDADIGLMKQTVHEKFDTKEPGP